METTAKTETPADYMADAQGRLVPISTIREIDLLRDDLVNNIVERSKQMSAVMAAHRADIMGEIEAFADLSAERFGVTMGGNKGNITLTSYDGRYQVRRAVAEHLVFDERLQIAKELIDDCIRTWSTGTRAEIMALINDAFQVDKEGKINTKRILSLRRLDINDPQWQKAMQAIGESLQVSGSKTYIRVYERQHDGSYQQIPLA
ncbi:MAG: DUF3164 family protein [Desulfuromonadaceae bacterium]|nr:DUF3164 family protein [Desulfuromonadaceae bacterium]